MILLSFELVSRRARAFIDDIVSRGHESSNGQSGSMQEMIIPAGKAGLIIGKGGETIKQLQVRLVESLLHSYGYFIQTVNTEALLLSSKYVLVYRFAVFANWDQ